MKLIKNIKYFILPLLIIMFVSCEKENLINKTNDKILKFNSIEELNKHIDKTLKMNHNELKDLEESRGFKSFGRICDEIYFNLNIEKLTSFEQVEIYVNNHSDYLFFEKDEFGEIALETVFSKNPYRYVMNEDKLFILNNRVIKVFGNVLLSTNVENIEELKMLKDNYNISTLLNEKFEIFSEVNVKNTFSQKDATYNCGNDLKEARVTTYNDRTKISMQFTTQTQINNGTTWNLLCVDWEVRPYKKILGIWYYCTRTLLWDFNVRADYLVTNTPWSNNKFHTYGQTIDPEWSIGGIAIIVATNGSFSSYHYGGYKCYGRSLSNNGINASMLCNSQLF